MNETRRWPAHADGARVNLIPRSQHILARYGNETIRKANSIYCHPVSMAKE